MENVITNNNSRISGWARKLYDKVPATVRSIAYPVVRCRRFLKQLRVDLWQIDGVEMSTGQPLVIACGTAGQNKSLLLGLIFGDSPVRERQLGPTWLWNVNRVVRKSGSDCALAFIGLRHTNLRRLGSPPWIFIPCWVNGVVDIPFGPDVLGKENVRSDLRKIRNHALEYEVTRDLPSFDEFYHRMYVPHITRAHGAGGYIVPYNEKRDLFHKCDLLFVKMGDIRVAGVLLLHGPDGPRIWSLGVRDSNDEYVKKGAVAAVFHFSFQFLASQGHSRVRIGASRPFLRDGVLQFKRKLSQTIASGSPDGFGFKVLSYSPAVQGFLKANPFIYQDGDGLYGAVFVDPDAPLGDKELASLEKSNLHQGMVGLTVYRLGTGAEPPRALTCRALDRIHIRPAGDLIGKE